MDDRIAKVLVAPDDTLRVALQVLDSSAMRIAIVADDELRLIGVLTDGDVRRWILAGRGLEAPVRSAMNASPITVTASTEKAELESIMLEKGIDFVPVVDDDGIVVAGVRWTDLVSGAEKPAAVQLGLPVVIMAGGYGSRLAPYTKVLPKPLVPVGERPISEHIMNRFARFGCTDFTFSVNYRANLIRAYFADADLDYQIRFVAEEEPLGTGGSLSLMREQLQGSTFFVTNCDILVEADYADIVRFHRERGNAVTIVASMKHVLVPYGVCEIAEGGALTGITEKPQFDFLVSTGFYVLEPEVLADVPDGKLFHLTDLINDYLERDIKVGVYPVSEKSWFDIGQIEELRATLAHFDVE